MLQLLCLVEWDVCSGVCVLVGACASFNTICECQESERSKKEEKKTKPEIIIIIKKVSASPLRKNK